VSKTSKPFAGYIRISKTGSRTGPSFISPEVQQDAIERLALGKGIEIAEVVEERDVSGGRPIEERELGRLVECIKRGEYGGLVVWKISRFSRNLLDGVQVASDISKAGGRIIAEDLDTGQQLGKAILGLLLGFAEEERDQRKAGWREAQERAAKRGVWPSRPPIGYSKDADGCLVPNADAPAVTYAFRRRAAGDSLRSIARGIGEMTGRSGFAISNVDTILSGSVYLGHTINDDIRVEGTHQPLIDAQTWERVQAIERPKLVRTGSVAGKGILNGIAVCGGCGLTMTRGAGGKPGNRKAFYTCRKPDACPAPASAHVDKVDALVIPHITERQADGAALLDGLLVELHDAQVAQTRAERELQDFLAGASITDLGPELYAQEVTRRRATLNEAIQAHTAVLDAQEALISSESEVEQRRSVAAQLIERVVIGRAERRPVQSGWSPIEERVTVEWKAA
jgi:DNA invertase Pin-like site-specific DNA recombinase